MEVIDVNAYIQERLLLDVHMGREIQQEWNHSYPSKASFASSWEILLTPLPAFSNTAAQHNSHHSTMALPFQKSLCLKSSALINASSSSTNLAFVSLRQCELRHPTHYMSRLPRTSTLSNAWPSGSQWPTGMRIERMTPRHSL